MQETDNQITDLIPQRPPIVMISSMTGIENGISTSSLTIADDNIFVDDGILTECGLIEHMAQAAAARTGFIAAENRESVKPGYIASVNDFILKTNPQTGDTVTTTIEVVQEVANVSLIEAHSFVNGMEIASCRMKIFLEE